MQESELVWTWKGTPIRLGTTRAGEGRLVLLLPAPSSISTRHEWRDVQQRLSARFATVAVDWPGFGDLPRPRLDWRPELGAAFLDHLATMFPHPHATLAAGHAAGYALAQAAGAEKSLGRLCLVAPTWRGPLPTVLGRRHPALARLVAGVDLPLLGPLLYRLNVNRAMLGMMTRGHVYVDPHWLAGDRLAQKRAVIAAPGARHASIRFVAGALDPMQDRESFLAAAAAVQDPVLVVYGADMPRRSRAEVEALSALPGVQARELPAGKLSVHEEFPEPVFAAVLPFLADEGMA